MIATLIEETLTEQLCTIVGPCNSVDEAFAAARRGGFDVALLDVNLRGEKIYPVAEYLAERNVPFMLLTGYGSDAIPAGRPHWQACSKPFTARGLAAMLAEQVSKVGALPQTPPRAGPLEPPT